MSHAMAQPSMDECEEVSQEMIDEAMNGMKLELSRMSSAGKAVAYQKALEQDSTFVHEYKSLLSFLRAEQYDVTRAATRLAKFYSLKLEGFGVEKLTKDISQEDLTQQERDGLYDSMSLQLPFRDREGRSVLVKVVGLPLPSTPARELFRAGLYAALSHSQDEEDQRMGMTGVIYLVGDELGPKEIQKVMYYCRHWARLVESAPFRTSVIHVCYSSTSSIPDTTFRMSVDSLTGLRTMEHFGDHKTIQFALLNHGIPSLGFPIAANGTIHRHLSREFWTKRGNLEDSLRRKAAQMSQQSTDVPSIETDGDNAGTSQPSTTGKGRMPPRNDNDVLIGRGKFLYSHTGNCRMRKLAKDRLGEYESVLYAEKQYISHDIVRIIHKRGGAFLRPEEGRWIEVDEDVAREKVARTFRQIVRVNKQANT